MQHEISTTRIYMTTDFNIFKMLEGNRILDEKKVKSIMNDIRNGTNLLPFFPILVDADMNVLDGQHRLFVAKKLKYPIHYIISNINLNIFKIASLNSRVSRWNNRDFLNCYVRKENPDYIKLQAFMEKYQVKISVALQLLSKVEVRDSGSMFLKKAFEQGIFQIDKNEYDHSCKVMDLIEKEYSFLKSAKSRQFLSIFVPFIKQQGFSRASDLAKLIISSQEYIDKINSSNIKYYLSVLIKEKL